VTVANGLAHVRDLAEQSDVVIGGRPFFPIDNYAPSACRNGSFNIGCRTDGRRKSWRRRPGRCGLNRAPCGSDDALPGEPRPATLERVAITGVVWGTETAWFEPESGRLVALMTGRGAAVRSVPGWVREAVQRCGVPRAAVAIE
jgi:hypothetical protein